MTIKKRSEGFTLVEILVVVGIIAILSVITIAYINPSILLKRARDDQRLAEMKQIQSALEAYKGDHGTYPSLGTVATPASGWNRLSAIVLNNVGGTAGMTATVTYLRKIPTGPNGTGSNCLGYHYAVSADYKSYTLFVNLEDVNSDEALSTKSIPTYSSSGITPDAYKSFYFTSGICNGINNKFNYWVNNP